MASGPAPTRRPSMTDAVDACFFAFSGAAAAWFAYVLLREGVRPGWPSLLLVVFWVFFTYLVLPRLHRILTRIYLPGYFIGRTRTSDGLLGDPVNLALHGREDQVHAAMSAAGWTRADDLGLRSGREIVVRTLRRRSYPAAPVSPLHLFERRQDFAYEQEVEGSPSRRHHVRFWRCPDGWLLPGGFAAGWLAAATYDRKVGVSLFTLQITHKIDENTDVERDFVVSTVTGSVQEVEVEVLEHFSSGYHARNGGGDRIRTDGSLPVLDLKKVGASEQPTVEAAAVRRDRLPASTVTGAAIALLRAVVYASVVVALLVDPQQTRYLGELGLSAAEVRDLAPVLAIGIGLAAVIDGGLGLAVLAGRNWARLSLMAVCSATAVTAFLATVGSDGRPIGLGSLPSLGGSILVLLALSSPSAREHAVRRRFTGNGPSPPDPPTLASANRRQDSAA
ncbi:LssY C-terminal domain-containing protein [Nocardioides euryhalodurans]|nr:LssY C-terminal domain-containing protein [Nocardioides euryhalodurans]